MLAMIALLAIPPTSIAATIRVPADQPTIQAGIDAAVAGDTVIVASGVYYEHGISLKEGVRLFGDESGAGTAIIEANGQGRVLECRYLTDVVIANITVSGGSGGAEGGGGLLCQSSTVLVRDCIFNGNISLHPAVGGAMRFIDADGCVVEDTAFIGNNSSLGAAVWSSGSANHIGTSLVRCRISHNVGTALVSGQGGTLTIQQSEISENTGSVAGSEVNGNIVMTGCLVASNLSTGNLIGSVYSALTLQGCTIAWRSQLASATRPSSS